MRWSPGDAVALREIWRGRVWEARPAIVVRDDPELRMFYVAPGNRSQVAVDHTGQQLRLPQEDWRLAEVQRLGHHVLSFASRDVSHAVLAFSDEAGEFLGW